MEDRIITVQVRESLLVKADRDVTNLCASQHTENIVKDIRSHGWRPPEKLITISAQLTEADVKYAAEAWKAFPGEPRQCAILTKFGDSARALGFGK